MCVEKKANLGIFPYATMNQCVQAADDGSADNVADLPTRPLAAQWEKAEAKEMDDLRKAYAKTGKAAGVTGKQLFAIDSSLFVDDEGRY